ncbi:MAG: universal stress protein [Actinobacteria bacterium]|nr:universal stress protein [Actinomycetota bacterium]
MLQLHPLGIIIGLLIGTCIVLILFWMLKPKEFGKREVREAEMMMEVSEFGKILVPTLGTMFSERMVALASKIAKTDLSKVFALFIVEVPMTLPADVPMPEIDVQGAAALNRAKVIGKKFGVEIEGAIERSRFAGKSIVDFANNKDVDLIVLSTSVKERFGELSMGRTVDYVFKNARCDVIVEKPAVYLK